MFLCNDLKTVRQLSLQIRSDCIYISYYSPSYDWMRSISVRNPSMRHNRKVSLVFNHLEPEELADHLTYLEYRAFRRINVSAWTLWHILVLLMTSFQHQHIHTHAYTSLYIWPEVFHSLHSSIKILEHLSSSRTFFVQVQQCRKFRHKDDP